MEPSTNKFIIPVAIVVAGALIAGAVYVTSRNKAEDTGGAPVFTDNKEINLPAISAADHILGNPNAPVIVVEYSDPECPFCKQFHTTMRQIMETYGKDGKVAWVYRHAPITQLHPKAPKEAEALECAGEIGGAAKFWEYANLLYDRTPSNNNLDAADLPKFAGEVGLEVSRFTTCLNSGKYAQKVLAEFDEGVGIATGAGEDFGTPFNVLVAGEEKVLLVGAYPYDAMRQAIDAALAQAAATKN